MKKLYILGFVFTLHIALAAYVNSTFLSQFLDEGVVGLVYTISSVLTLIAFSTSPLLLSKFGDRKSVFVAVLCNFLALLLLGTSQNAVILVIAFVTFSITNSVIALLLDVFFEHLEGTGSVAKMRGMYLSVTNLAWLVSPLISGLIISSYGHFAIYIVASVLAFLMLAGLFIARLPESKQYRKISIIAAFKHLNGNVKIRTIVALNFLLQFFYAIMVVYTPIYLIDHIGFDWETLGIIFTIMLAPFILFGIPVGKLIDRGWKEKNLLSIGFLIMGVSTITMVFVHMPDIILWGIVLFMTRVGAALVETTAEIYFFKRTTSEDSDLLSVFRDMSPLSYIVAPIAATILLFVFPFKSLFVLLGVLMLFGVVISKLWLTEPAPSYEQTKETIEA